MLLLTRRHFLRSASLAGAALLTARRLPGQSAPDYQFRSLRRGVGYFLGSGGTIGWLATPEALAVVDSQFPEPARALLAGLKERTSHPFDLLLNTHHHADHTGGNSILGPLAKVVAAHQSVPEWQRRAAAESTPPAEPFCASTLFASEWHTTLGDEVVRARHHGPAHTAGDAVVHFEQAGVVHLGDLVFNRRPPFIDRAAGGRIRNWIQTLETLHAAHGDDTLFIYGHAGPGFEVSGGRADLLVMRDYLGALLEFAGRARAAGRSEEEVAATELLPGFESWGAGRGRLSVGTNLRAAYQELGD